MTAESFDIIRDAITIAGNEEIRSLKNLRIRLAESFPGKEAEIEKALQTWADQERRLSLSY